MKLKALLLVGCIFLLSFHGSSGKPPKTSKHLKGIAPKPVIPMDYSVITRGNGFMIAYKFHPTRKTWNQARNTCHREGGFLAYVDYPDEARVYHEILRQKNSGGAWMGLHDMFEEGDWVTVLDESTRELPYLNWGPYEPNNYGVDGENCAELQMNGRLYDMTCQKELFFFCKMYLGYI